MRKDILRLRAGTGLIFILAGLLHWAGSGFAALYSLHLVHVVLTARLWSEFWFAQFLFLVLASLLYLTLGFRQCGIFYYEVLADFLGGLGVFIVLFLGVAVLLTYRRFNLWLPFVPGLFLIAYGLGLRQGRMLAFGPMPPPLP